MIKSLSSRQFSKENYAPPKVIAKATKNSKPVMQLRRDIWSSNLHLKNQGSEPANQVLAASWYVQQRRNMSAHLFQTFFNKLFSIQEHNFILWAWNRLHLHMLLFLNPRDNSLCLLQDEQLHKKLLALFHKKNSLIKRNGCSLTHGSNYSYHKDNKSAVNFQMASPWSFFFEEWNFF